MHSSAELARLKSNKLAYEHFEKFRPTYLRYASLVRETFSGFHDTTPKSRAAVVKTMILELDPHIWALATYTMTADLIAELMAVQVVGHEN
jgi:hypothetical protein